jgi:hypothetical protein
MVEKEESDDNDLEYQKSKISDNIDLKYQKLKIPDDNDLKYQKSKIPKISVENCSNININITFKCD